MQFPVSIKLHRSFLLSSLLFLFHALAAACIAVLPWDWLVRSIFWVGVSVSAGYVLRPSKVLALRLVAPGRMLCLDSEAHLVEIKPCPETTVFSRLIVLRFKTEEGSRVRTLTLLPDQMSVTEFRSLRLWLRWQTPNQRDVEVC